MAARDTAQWKQSGGKRLRRMLPGRMLADGLVANRGAHEKIEKHETAKSKSYLDDAADERIELQEAAERPARGPGSANHLRTDKNGDSNEGRNMDPVDFLRLSQNAGCSISSAGTQKSYAFG
jgi:hypothetical protein